MYFLRGIVTTRRAAWLPSTYGGVFLGDSFAPSFFSDFFESMFLLKEVAKIQSFKHNWIVWILFFFISIQHEIWVPAATCGRACHKSSYHSKDSVGDVYIPRYSCSFCHLEKHNMPVVGPQGWNLMGQIYKCIELWRASLWHQNWVVATQFMSYFHSYLEKILMLTNIFQRGWNHQLENVCKFIMNFSCVLELSQL